MIWKEFEIKAEYFGHKNWPCDSKFTNYNYHKVYIKNTKVGISTNFEYWASNAHPVVESDLDIMEAVQCFLSDAIAGDMDFEQFCGEFGYDIYKSDGYPNANSKRIWKACVRAREKYDRVFVGYNLYDLANELNDAIEAGEWK